MTPVEIAEFRESERTSQFERRPSSGEPSAADDEGSRTIRARLKAQMADVLVHDFSNLLTGASGFVGLAQTSVPSDSQAAKFLSKLDIIIDGAVPALRDYSDYVSYDAPPLAPIDPNEVLNRIAKFAPRLIGNRCALEISPTSENGMFMARGGQVVDSALCLLLHLHDAFGGQCQIRMSAIWGMALPTKSQWESSDRSGRRASIVISAKPLQNGNIETDSAQSHETELIRRTDRIPGDLRVVDRRIRRNNGRLRMCRKSDGELTFELRFPELTRRTG